MNKDQLFQKVYAQNYPKVIRLCLGFANGDNEMAKDLAQEVFIKTWENLETFRNEASLSTWIFRITVNTCLSQHQRKVFIPLKSEAEAEEKDYEKDENRFKQMYKCIDALSPLNKSIILLELENVPQLEIAGIIGLSHEALRTRIHRIKNQLSICVKNG